ESKGGDDLHGEFQHGGFRITRPEKRIVDGRCRTNRTNELDLAWTQLLEDRCHFRGLHRWLEVVQQYVVRMFGMWEKRHVASLQCDDLFQIRLEGREVRVRARLSPRLLTGGDCFGELGDKRRRHFGCLLVVSRRDLNEPPGGAAIVDASVFTASGF